MTRYFILGSFLLLSLPCRSAIITAASVERADVQAAINTATNGDTVQIPAGIGYYTNSLGMGNKILTVQGAGTNETILVDEIVSRSVSLIYIGHSTTNGLFRLTQLQLRGGVTNTGHNFFGIISVVGKNALSNNPPWRIDHVYFNKPKGRPINAYAYQGGLIDNCYFDMTGALPGMSFDGRTPDSNNKGDASWSQPVYMGTTNEGLYIEHNVITNDSLRAITDGFAGARYVFRYNTCYNVSAENHGTESTSRPRSTRWMAVYGNRFTNTVSPGSGKYAVYYRGGSGVVFSNVVHDFAGLATMVNYRSTDDFSPWGQAHGTNVWDTNDVTGGLFLSGSHTGTINGTNRLVVTNEWTDNQWVGYHVWNTNTGKRGEVFSNTTNAITFLTAVVGSSMPTWTNGHGFEIRKVIKALDQPGTGSGVLLSGGNDSTAPTPVGYPNTDEPIYYWNNTGNNLTVYNGGYQSIVNGRDYTNAVLSSYTPLSDPHPLALSASNAAASTARLQGKISMQGKFELR